MKVLLLIAAVCLISVANAASIAKEASSGKAATSFGAYNTAMLSPSLINTKYYYASKILKLTWAEAMAFCAAFKGDLPYFVDIAEHTAVTSFLNLQNLRTVPVFIGGMKKDKSPTNAWNWLMDGSVIGDTLNMWASGEPNTSGNNCAAMLNDHWVDANCETASNFICVVPAPAF